MRRRVVETLKSKIVLRYDGSHGNTTREGRRESRCRAAKEKQEALREACHACTRRRFLRLDREAARGRRERTRTVFEKRQEAFRRSSYKLASSFWRLFVWQRGRGERTPEQLIRVGMLTACFRQAVRQAGGHPVRCE